MRHCMRASLASAIDACLAHPRRANLRLGSGIAGIGMACCAASALGATTHVVTTAQDPGPGGTLSLRQAVFLANGSTNDIIQFDPALNGSTITLQQGQIAITASMYIAGNGSAATTISGNGASRIFYAAAPPAAPLSVTLSGVKLTNGTATAGSTPFGGAIYAKDTALEVRNSILSGNHAGYGGAVWFSNGLNVTANSTFTGVSIIGNDSAGPGGAFYSSAASLSFVNCDIGGNTAASYGGGIALHDAELTLAGSSVHDNQASKGAGGGIYVPSGTAVIVTDSTISGNQAAGTKGNGGGLAVYRAYLKVQGSTVSGNSAAVAGGGVYFRDPRATPTAKLSLFTSTISGNTAALGGGAIAKGAASITVDNLQVSGNIGYNSGGGIVLQGVAAKSDIINSTFYGNYGYGAGGAIQILDAATGNGTTLKTTTIAGNSTFNYASNGISGSGTVTINSTIVANNFSHAGTQDLEGTFNENYSLVRNVGTASVIGSGNKNGQNPLLGPLAVNGGPTLTMLPDANSPVLDSGDPLFTSGTDQRGLPRFVHGRVDMGAVERQYPEDVIFRNGFN